MSGKKLEVTMLRGRVELRVLGCIRSLSAHDARTLAVRLMTEADKADTWEREVRERFFADRERRGS